MIIKQVALFEKSAQKLLLIWRGGVQAPRSQIDKKSLGSFFQKRTAFSCLFLAASIGAASASDTSRSFAVHGVGALTCAKLNAVPAADAAEVRMVLASWIMGYVTAVNRTQSGTYDATPVQDQGAMVNMVAGVCAQHPNAAVETITNAVLTSLETAKLSAPSPEVTVTVGKRATVLRQSTLQSLQQVLIAQKYLPAGEADGKFGAGTQAALVKFQTAQHLPATGLPDPATVVRALIET
jgi:hypothetical protein